MFDEKASYILTINVSLILKVLDIIFFSHAKHIMGHAPLYVLPQTKKIISRTFKIRGTLVFLCPREIERKRREREQERERERERAGKGKRKGTVNNP